MTLALLLTAVTGAWAQSYEAKVFDVPASWEEDNTHISAADLPKDFVQITKDEAKALAVPDGDVVLVYGFVGENVLMMAFDNGTAIPYDDDDGAPVARGNFIMFQTMAKVCYTTPAGPKVAWNASTKSGTFAMPASDVVLTPIYAKAAAFATTGTEPEVKPLLPAAAEGVIAGTDASLIAEGTGIVAFAGTSTEDTQGTLMYAIGTSATEAPALTDFSATVPTAKDIADDGATVYVWYYIQGADAPDGVAATLDNTFDNTEPACLTVQVLTNKFDIQFNAANANTIEAGKATVTVGGTAATVTEGKLQGVKMGSEVKLKANTGYKFRKVEVKKKAEKTITIGTQNYTVLDGETWKQFITRNQLSGWYVDLMKLSTWGVFIDEPYSKLHVSSDGTNWTQLVFSSQDAPIDTDKQYKWVQEDIGGGDAPF